MKKIISLIFVFLFSCNNEHHNNGLLVSKIKDDNLEIKLLGQWGGLGEDSPVWEIRKDSIYYFQESKAYPYQLLDSNLTVERANSKFTLKILSVVKDTMTFEDDLGMKTYGYRFKKNKY